jgi:hypothetical protein
MAKRAPHEQYAWSQINKQIGQQLRAYYEAALSEELPPRLRAALENLDQEQPQRRDERAGSPEQGLRPSAAQEPAKARQ